MKLKVDKTIDGGSYKVIVVAVSFTPDESSKISKFGSPLISIAPRTFFNGRSTLRALPIHTINHSFVFDKEEEADQFVTNIKERIQSAMEELRGKEDKFTEEKEYEI
jgi:hypothetical protein